MTDTIRQLIAQQKQYRRAQQLPGLKINLYRGFEVKALARVAQQLNWIHQPSPLECCMVGDSYFTTHLGRASTRLNTFEEKVWGLETLLSLITEVRSALNQYFHHTYRPYLIGDLPDGSFQTVEMAMMTAERMRKAGADVIKLEIYSNFCLELVNHLTKQGFLVMGHIGYLPQKNGLRRQGETLDSAMTLLEQANRIHSAGAVALVIELVSEVVHRRLSLPVSESMPQLYSIFSGSAPCSGQSLNVWDAVIKPDFDNKYFPPTATLSQKHRNKYTIEVIAEHLYRLIDLTIRGIFPLTPNTRLTTDTARQVMSYNPWKKNFTALKDQKIVQYLEQHESNTRVYCRKFPRTFERAKGSLLYDCQRQKYIDYFCGAGAVNYGHNHPFIIQAIQKYLDSSGIIHGLDLFTKAKYDFFKLFQEKILIPKNMQYKLQCTGPTGTNAVEAALKIVRKNTGRHNVISFTNGFHGMTLGALAMSGNRFKRAGASALLSGSCVMPYDGYLGNEINTIEYIEKCLKDKGSGIDLPAAFIVETIQGEGGLNAASSAWLEQLGKLAKQYDILLILDEIQAGCGRTGKFFSFEGMDIIPDIICLSKSLSATGLPLSLVLLRPELDQQQPGEHSGTFRGNNLAFVSASAALSLWENSNFLTHLNRLSHQFSLAIRDLSTQFLCKPKGRGLFAGLTFVGLSANRISQEAFKRKLLIEPSGSEDCVIKLMPALTMPLHILEEGMNILETSINASK